MIDDPRSSAPGTEVPIRILVVDDAAEARVLLRLFLNDAARFAVEAAEDGVSAIDMHKARPYDLILLDLLMPKVDGYRVAEEIRFWEKREERRRTPIIAVSATEPQEGQRRSLRAGIDGFIPKPVKRETLLAVIERLVRRASKDRAPA